MHRASLVGGAIGIHVTLTLLGTLGDSPAEANAFGVGEAVAPEIVTLRERWAGASRAFSTVTFALVAAPGGTLMAAGKGVT